MSFCFFCVSQALTLLTNDSVNVLYIVYIKINIFSVNVRDLCLSSQGAKAQQVCLPAPWALQLLPDMLTRLSRAPVVSIVSIRGHARLGAGKRAFARERYASGDPGKSTLCPVNFESQPSDAEVAQRPGLHGISRSLYEPTLKHQLNNLLNKNHLRKCWISRSRASP